MVWGRSWGASAAVGPSSFYGGRVRGPVHALKTAELTRLPRKQRDACDVDEHDDPHSPHHGHRVDAANPDLSPVSVFLPSQYRLASLFVAVVDPTDRRLCIAYHQGPHRREVNRNGTLLRATRLASYAPAGRRPRTSLA